MIELIIPIAILNVNCMNTPIKDRGYKDKKARPNLCF